MFRSWLEKIVAATDGAIAGLIMGFDGISVDTVVKSNDIDMNNVSMEFSFVLTQVRKAAEILQVGALHEVSIRSERITFIVRILTDEYFLALALRPEGNSGKGRYMMRLAEPELRAQL